MKMMSRFLTSASALASAFAGHGAALAQATPSDDAAAERVVLNPADDIIVSARRTSERLQSTPVSVTAFTGESLREANIRVTADLMMKTPGVYLGGSGSRDNIVFQIRGQSRARNGSNPPAVISYFADVPQPNLASGVVAYDMSSVQVLKGPQGTLFGRNTTGGAVLFYPVLPDYNFGGYVEAGYGRYDRKSLEGAITLPIIADKLAVRVAGQYDKRKGWTKDITRNVRMDGNNSRAFRASVVFDPTETIRNVTIYDYFRNDYNGDAVILTGLRATSPLLDPVGLRAAAIAALQRQQARGIRATENDMLSGVRTRKWGITNRTDIELGDDLSLTNIFGYRHVNFSGAIGTDGLPALASSTIPGAVFAVLHSTQRSRVEQYTNEVQFKAKLGDDIDLLLGGFYLKSKPYGATGGGSKTLSTAPATRVVTAFAYNFTNDTSKALFANANVKLDAIADGLRLNAGVRYTWDKVDACTAGDVTTQGDIGPGACRNKSDPRLVNPTINRTKSDAPTWQIGLDWQIDKDLFAYVASRRGYRSGGINSPTLAGRLVPFQGFGAEKVTDIEAGLRTDWNLTDDIRFRWNGTGFIGWYSGVTTSLSGVRTLTGCVAGDPVRGQPPFSPDGDCITSNDPNGGSLVVNAGKTRVSGIEVDGFLAFGRNFRITYAGSLIDPKATAFSVPAAIASYVPNGTTIGFDFVAKKQGSLGAQYKVPMGEGEMVANVDLFFSGRRSFVDVKFASYQLVNARLDWNNIAGTAVDLGIYATNLFNEKYVAQGAFNGPSTGVESSLFGPPAQYGVTLRYRFGG